jgi:hypothetical protein
MGDLILTCTSNLSRNYRVGVRLAREQLPAILQNMLMVAEGVRIVVQFTLARQLAVEMPIVEQVYALLYEGNFESVSRSSCSGNEAGISLKTALERGGFSRALLRLHPFRLLPLPVRYIPHARLLYHF